MKICDLYLYISLFLMSIMYRYQCFEYYFRIHFDLLAGIKYFGISLF